MPWSKYNNNSFKRKNAKFSMEHYKSNPMAPVASLQQRRRSTNPLPITVTVGGSYQYLEGPDSLLGHGTFGSVYRAYHLASGNKVAIKKMDNRKIKVEELSILRCLNSQYVVNLLEVFVPDNEPFTYLVMELCDNDLSRHLKRLDQSAGLSNHDMNIVISDLAKGYSALYDMSIIHMDIKPENIMVCYESMHNAGDRMRMVKLCDFGSSRIANTAEDTFTTLVGTPLYMAPEIAANVLELNEYNHQVDMWSLGVVLYQCATGEIPFDERYLCKLILYAATGNFVCYSCPELPKSLPVECQSIIIKLLELNSESRLTPPGFISLVNQSIDALRLNELDESTLVNQNPGKSNALLNGDVPITRIDDSDSPQAAVHESLMTSTPESYKKPLSSIPDYMLGGGYRSERSGSFDVNLVKNCQIDRSIKDTFETSRILANTLRNSNSLNRSLGTGSSECGDSSSPTYSDNDSSDIESLATGNFVSNKNTSYLKVTNSWQQKSTGMVLHREESMEDVIEEDEDTHSRSSGGFGRNSSYRSLKSIDAKTDSSEENTNGHLEGVNHNVDHEISSVDDHSDDDDRDCGEQDCDSGKSSDRNESDQSKRTRKLARPSREITPEEIKSIIAMGTSNMDDKKEAVADSNVFDFVPTGPDVGGWAKCSGLKLVKLYAELASCSYCLFQAREHML